MIADATPERQYKLQPVTAGLMIILERINSPLLEIGQAIGESKTTEEALAAGALNAFYGRELDRAPKPVAEETKTGGNELAPKNLPKPLKEPKETKAPKAAKGRVSKDGFHFPRENGVCDERAWKPEH